MSNVRKKQMTPHQTLAVTVRLFALWLFFYAIPNLLGIYKSITKYSGSESMHYYFLMASGVMLAICLLLWFFPLFIAKRILPLSKTFDSQAPEFQSWFSVGSCLIGLWLLVAALPSLFSNIAVFIVLDKTLTATYTENPYWLVQILYSTFQFIIGFWLFIGGKGLKKVLHWVKYA